MGIAGVCLTRYVDLAKHIGAFIARYRGQYNTLSNNSDRVADGNAEAAGSLDDAGGDRLLDACQRGRHWLEQQVLARRSRPDNDPLLSEDEEEGEAYVVLQNAAAKILNEVANVRPRYGQTARSVLPLSEISPNGQASYNNEEAAEEEARDSMATAKGNEDPELKE